MKQKEKLSVTTQNKHPMKNALKDFAPNKTNIMLDLETLGTTPGCIILSIGACHFDLTGIKSEFYAKIKMDESQKAGFTVDADTLCWWLKQEDAPRLEVANQVDALHPAEAMQRFHNWVGNRQTTSDNPNNVLMWGNGSEFDCAILRAYVSMYRIGKIWSDGSNNRCYRTVKNLFPHVPKPEANTSHHNALADAKWQAEHLISILNNLVTNYSDVTVS